MHPAIRPLVLTVALSAASVASATPGQSLVDLEARWSHAYVAKDIPAIQAMMASDWTMQNDSGHLITKPEVVEDVKSGKLGMTVMNNHDVHARIMGDFGVVQGSDTETSTYAGKDTSGTYSWTDVFQKRDGRWVAIASQVTKVK